MGLSQSEMAGEVGTRQQTISEWETGQYRPRGASAKLLSIIAESAGFAYQAGGAETPDPQVETRDSKLETRGSKLEAGDGKELAP